MSTKFQAHPTTLIAGISHLSLDQSFISKEKFIMVLKTIGLSTNQIWLLTNISPDLVNIYKTDFLQRSRQLKSVVEYHEPGCTILYV